MSLSKIFLSYWVYNHFMTGTTRDELLNYFSDCQAHTIADLSQNLNLTKADIRYQLRKLLKEKSILATKDLYHYPQGRPAVRYIINRVRQPENYREIVEILLALSANPAELEDEIANDLIKKLNLNQSQALISRLNHLIEELNKRNYKARWETRPNGPVVILGNCPYYSLLIKHPQFCKIDKKLIESVTNQNPIIHLQSFLNENNCKFQLVSF